MVCGGRVKNRVGMRNLEIVDRFLRLNLDAREIVPSCEVREGCGKVALPTALLMELELRIGSDSVNGQRLGKATVVFRKFFGFFALFCVALVMGAVLRRCFGLVVESSEAFS